MGMVRTDIYSPHSGPFQNTEQRDSRMIIKRIVWWVCVIFLCCVSMVFLFLGQVWLYTFLLTDYRAHLWQWGVLAGSVALLLGIGGLWAAYQMRKIRP